MDAPLEYQKSTNLDISPQRNTRKILLFEIICVVISLILILGVLNYFNILPLSKLFPDYLGFLPRRDVPIGTSQSIMIDENNPRQGFPTSIPSLTENAKKALIGYLPTILYSSLLATSSSNITFIKEEKIEGYTAYWETQENGLVKVVFSPSSSGNSINSLTFVFHKIHSTLPSKEVAQDLAPKAFLVTPKGEWECKNIPNNPRLYCENFWEEDGVKRGIALEGYHPDSTSKTSTIILCEHRKGSKDYEAMKSCISP